MDTKINITRHCNRTGTSKRRDDNNLSQTINAHARSSMVHELIEELTAAELDKTFPRSSSL